MNPIETHEKNLAWIDNEEAKHYYSNHEQDQTNTNCIELKSFRANRKTLERHAPIEMHAYIIGYQGARTLPDHYYICGSCYDPIDEGPSDFPCPTYTDVLDGLGISE